MRAKFIPEQFSQVEYATLIELWPKNTHSLSATGR
ncbi:MAG: hypothetical protein RLZZ360_593 [Candidatus Parcubacteria bacterium]|jgi:hypothetical protein